MFERQAGWRKQWVRAMTVLIGLTFVVGACAGSDESALGEPDAAEESEQLLIVASTPVLADLVSNLVDEEVGRVEVLVDRGENPLSAELTAKDLQLLDQADLVVSIGAGFEPFKGELNDLEKEKNGLVLKVGTELLDEGGDPIIWTDPDLMAKGVLLIAQKLAELDTRLATNEAADHADAYADSLRELDRKIAERFAGLTEEQRDLTSGQDLLGHLAERYELHVVVAQLFESGEPVNPEEVRAELAESNARILVVDETFPVTADMEPVAESFGLEPIALPILTLGPPASETGTYLSAMDALTRDLANALAQ